jgi:hypothetical protein
MSRHRRSLQETMTTHRLVLLSVLALAVGAPWLEQARFDGGVVEFGKTLALTGDGATLFTGAQTSQSTPSAGAVHVF